MKLKALLFPFLLICSHSALGVLDLNQARGEKTISFLTPKNNLEVCVIQKKWQPLKFEASDLKEEDRLCSYDFYGLTNSQQAVGVCAKQNSTSPALLINKLPSGQSISEFESNYCKGKNKYQDVKAKFKQTISCSHSSSQLLYYHFSKYLGNILRIPTAVLRTMEISKHHELTQIALSYFGDSHSLIAQNWRNYAKYHRNPNQYPQVFDQSLNFVYGSLIENPKKEMIYSEVSGHGDYETRYERFMRQTPFQWTASSQTVLEIAKSNSLTLLIPVLQQMKDVSDMVLIDTLLNQQDRIGNIHFKYVWYGLEPQTQKFVRSAKDPQDPSFIRVKEMLLKDNDCGISKENKMRAHSALEKVSHMSLNTYKNFFDLAEYYLSTEGKSYFIDEFLLSESEYLGIAKNFKKAKEILSSRCKAGLLKLDLDFALYFNTGTARPEVNCLP